MSGPSTLFLWLGLGALAAYGQGDPPHPPLPPAFTTIHVAFVGAEQLERSVDVPGEREDWEEGSEKPPTVWFRPRTGDGTFAVLTDASLCTRPAEHEICEAFAALLAGPRPAMNTDIAGSRLEDSGAATVYLAPLSGVRLAFVDALAAFLGGDTQSGPPVEPAVYIYARRGSNLIELHAPLGKCDHPVPQEFWDGVWRKKPLRTPAEVEKATIEYYTEACANAAILARARVAAKRLTERYAIAP